MNQAIADRRADGRCPGCGKIPSAEECLARKCSCGVALIPEGGVKAAPNTEAILEQSEFHFQEDASGDKYYVGPVGHIVHVYADGTWDSDKAGAEQSLEKYLARIGGKTGGAA